MKTFHVFFSYRIKNADGSDSTPADAMLCVDAPDISDAAEKIRLALQRLVDRPAGSEPGKSIPPKESAESCRYRSLLENARNFVRTTPPAISGKGGHAHTFSVARTLVESEESQSLSDSDIWTLLLEFNQRCQPPWSEADLRDKLVSVIRCYVAFLRNNAALKSIVAKKSTTGDLIETVAIEDCTHCNHTGREPGYGPNHYCRRCWGRTKADIAVIKRTETR